MSKDLIVIQDVKLVPFFTKGDSVDDVLEQIAKEARALVPDVSTTKGRNEIKANVTKVTGSKTYLEAEGKDLATEYKAIPKLIDANRKKVKDFLNDLQAEIRKPLTDWEEEQKAIKLEEERVKAEQERIDAIDADYDFAILLMKTDFDERAAKVEADRLAQIAHEQKIASEAAAQAISDEKLRQKEESDRIQRESIEAEQREAKAIQEAHEAKFREEQAVKQAKIDADNAEARRVEGARLAEVKRLADIETARQDEIARQDAEKEAERVAQEKAARNNAHVASTHAKLKSIYIAAEFPEDLAEKAVKLLVKNKLPGATFKY